MSLTDAEIRVTALAAETATAFSLLPVTHPSDLNDVIFHIHAIQNIIMARSAQRAHPHEFPTYDQMPERKRKIYAGPGHDPDCVNFKDRSRT
jgi:hypothetical protein